MMKVIWAVENALVFECLTEKETRQKILLEIADKAFSFIGWNFRFFYKIGCYKLKLETLLEEWQNDSINGGKHRMNNIYPPLIGSIRP